MKIVEEVLHIDGGFASASGNLYSKKILFLDFEEDEPFSNWEVTYSPSMGYSYEEIRQDLFNFIKQPHNYQFRTQLVQSHIDWYHYLKTRKQERCATNLVHIKGLEFDLNRKYDGKNKEIDFLRLKAKVHMPNWLPQCHWLPEVIIIDYNNSCDEETLEKDIKAIQTKFPDIQLYIEQPFENLTEIHRIVGVSYIFDCKDYTQKIEKGLILEGDILNFKIGRNTTKEYEEAFQNGFKVMFGNVNSSEVGYEICDLLSHRFANIEFDVL